MKTRNLLCRFSSFAVPVIVLLSLCSSLPLQAQEEIPTAVAEFDAGMSGFRRSIFLPLVRVSVHDISGAPTGTPRPIPVPTGTPRPTTTPTRTPAPTDTLEPTPTHTPEPTPTNTPSPPTPTEEPTGTPGPAALPAFPGAEGFGAMALGGRGGQVIEVTNLNNSGPGSLRAAIEAEGARIIVFRTGGTIELQSSLWVKNPFITIAGQSAPGRIVLRNDPGNKGPALVVQTHDVVIRYLALRPGPSAESSEGLDALSIHGDGNGGVYNIVVDHCSLSWATDGVLDTWSDVHDITIQWNIVAEGLDCSTHGEGCHSTGVLLGSDGAHNISFHHNLMAHNVARGPMIKTSGTVDVVNNVVYDQHNSGSGTSNLYAPARVNYVGNIFIRGLDTDAGSYYITVTDESDYAIALYLHDNVALGWDADHTIKSKALPFVVDERHDAPTVTTVPSANVINYVLDDVGATVYLDAEGRLIGLRDEVDERIIDDVRSGTGHIIDDPSEVGGWPELAAGTPPADTDHDGMPDEWENLYGFDPNNSSDGPVDADRDGYTNVEEYLNGTTP